MAPTPPSIADQYVRRVMDLIHAPAQDRSRIEADLRAHLQEGLAQGEDMLTLVERMGDPRQVAAEFMAQIPMVYASFWRRLGAFAIDMIVILLLSGICAILVVLLNDWVPQHPATTWEQIWAGIVILLILISANACIAMILAYFPLLEVGFGKTLGKRLLGLRVCTEEGLQISTGQAIMRRLSFYFEILPIDALFVFFKPKRQRGFDILAHTVVIED